METEIMQEKIIVTRMNNEFRADPKRVITKLFLPNEERARKIANRVLSLSESEIYTTLNEVINEFGHRHHNFKDILLRHFEMTKHFVTDADNISIEAKMLIGSYFTSEYSIESAAFFNPSIVSAPDQSNVPPGSERVVMSFRSTGEGHLSSIEFRSGILDSESNFFLEEPSNFLEASRICENMRFRREECGAKLIEYYIPQADNKSDATWDESTKNISLVTDFLEELDEEFGLEDLHNSLARFRTKNTGKIEPERLEKIIGQISWLARSNYDTKFSKEMDISERVIFPVTENESRGIEDARFVCFEENGERTYYATYTAYDGNHSLSQVLETKDFLDFKIRTISGEQNASKGLALFPRKINGEYMMIARSDGENLFILSSPDVLFWHKAQPLQIPTYPWEFMQIGNCGSPVETKEGWILLTHGVGPMRKYSLGATLLDLEDPSRIIAQTPLPILEPNEYEREGYVPNVVYTCGCMLHNDQLIIPYAMSDSASNIAKISVDELLDYMKQ